MIPHLLSFLIINSEEHESTLALARVALIRLTYKICLGAKQGL